MDLIPNIYLACGIWQDECLRVPLYEPDKPLGP